MTAFFQTNATTVIVLVILAGLLCLAIRKIVKDKKAGIGPCGQKCADCPHAADCSAEEKT